MLPPLRAIAALTIALSACGDVKATVDSGGGGFALTVALAGDGTGTVTSNPSGINCGADCTESFASGTSVTLTPTGIGSSTFAGWSGGDCTGTGACTISISAATTVTAMFTNQRTLTVTLLGGGAGTITSNPAGINCGAVCSAPFAQGTTVVLSQAASPTGLFQGWSGACTGSGACGVTLTGANATVSATFVAASRVGETTPFTETSSATPGYLLGQRIVVPTTKTLGRFGVIVSVATGNMKMALYADSAGAPGALVAQTASTATAVGNLEILPTVANVSLPAGTYWIMATYDVTGRIFYTNATNMNVIDYIALPYASAMPNPFGVPMTYMNSTFNYYLVLL